MDLSKTTKVWASRNKWVGGWSRLNRHDASQREVKGQINGSRSLCMCEVTQLQVSKFKRFSVIRLDETVYFLNTVLSSFSLK